MRITWAADLVFDLDLHKTSRLQILQSLSKRGNRTEFIGARSRAQFNQKIGKEPHLILMPLRYLPLIEPLFFSLLLAFFLPFYIIRKKPDYMILEPELSVLGTIPTVAVSKLTKTHFISRYTKYSS